MIAKCDISLYYLSLWGKSRLIDIRDVHEGFLGQSMCTFGSGLPADE